MNYKAWFIELVKSCRYPGLSQFIYSCLYARRYKRDAIWAGVKMKDIDAASLLKSWSSLSKVWELTTYKYFANYTDNIENIIPESVGRTCIEPVLNPIRFRPYYSDKNLFAKICGEDNVPKTLICRIMGGVIFSGQI